MTATDRHDIPSQAGRTIVVTGANSGIGFEAARALAEAGAHVVLACRNVEKGTDAAARIDGSTEVRRLDTADLASVREFAASVTDPIDVLINNAGIMAVDEGRTGEGFELQFATNYLGPFALTGLLLDRIRDRVVMLSSAAHRIGRIALDDLNWQRRTYSRWGAYGQSKLADLMFAYELEHRLVAAGSPVRAMAAHPGLASTNLMGGVRMPTALQVPSRAILTALGQPADRGALPTLYAATVADLPGGTYVGPDGIAHMTGDPVPVGSSVASHDRTMQRMLWDESERLTGVEIHVAA